MAEADLHVTFDEDTELKQKIEVEVEHTFGITAFVYVLLLGSFLFGHYDDEIKCALGNQKVCATMAIPKSP